MSRSTARPARAAGRVPARRLGRALVGVLGTGAVSLSIAVSVFACGGQSADGPGSATGSDGSDEPLDACEIDPETGSDTGEDAVHYSRVVAIGDLHGDLQVTKEALMLAGATDQSGDWIAGDELAIVQVGDQIDRGFDNRPTLDYMRELAVQAEAAGGVVHSLLGNHETDNARGSQAGIFLAKYANAESLAQFDDIEWDEEYIATWEATYGLPEPGDFEFLTYTDEELQTTPDEWKGQLTAYHPGGPYALHFSEREVILLFQRTLYVHGGVLPWHVEYGIDNINRDVRCWLQGTAPEPYDIVSGLTDGPLWTRALSDPELEPEGYRVENYCELVEQVLTSLDADRMVVGHAVREDVLVECDGQLIMIDVGLSSYYQPWGGGEVKLLQIVDGDQITVLQ